MPSHSHDNPKQSKSNLMLLYSYLSLLPYILGLPQINSGNKPSLSEDALINFTYLLALYIAKTGNDIMLLHLTCDITTVLIIMKGNWPTYQLRMFQ